MFETVTLNRKGKSGEPIDLGALAEHLVFYGKVRLVVDPVRFGYLIKECNPDTISELIEGGHLQLVFLENLPMTLTAQYNVGPLHNFGAVSTNDFRFPQVARKIFEGSLGGSGKRARKAIRFFEEHTERFSYDTPTFDAARSDLADHGYTSLAAASLLAAKAPEYHQAEEIYFRASKLSNGMYKVDSNLDFATANQSYPPHAVNPNDSLTEALILTHILTARTSLTIAMSETSDFLLDDELTVFLSAKFASLLARATNSQSALDTFVEDTLPNYPTIREVVNSGGRPFSDIVPIVSKASKFKQWIGSQSLDRPLISEYVTEISKLDGMEKLPSKTLRFVTVNAAGIAVGLALANPLAGLVGGLAISAADSFLLDKLLKRWKPSQFIESSIKQFLENRS